MLGLFGLWPQAIIPEAICGKRIYLMNGEFDEGDDSVDRVGDFWQQMSVLDQFLDANLANNV